jgi:hypothetical protein
MSSASGYALERTVHEAIQTAANLGSAERLRAVYAAHGTLIRDKFRRNERGHWSNVEEVVLKEVIHSLCRPGDDDPNYFEVLTVFFRELGGRVDIAPKATIFTKIIHAEGLEKKWCSNTQESERLFEVIRRVVTHLVETLGLPISNAGPLQLYVHLSHPDSPNLIEAGIEGYGWASLFAFEPYLGFPREPLRRYVESLADVHHEREWTAYNSYVLNRLLRRTGDRALERLLVSMRLDLRTDVEGPAYTRLRAEHFRRQDAARELALHVGTMPPGAANEVLRHPTLADDIAHLAFGRPELSHLV